MEPAIGYDKLFAELVERIVIEVVRSAASRVDADEKKQPPADRGRSATPAKKRAPRPATPAPNAAAVKKRKKDAASAAVAAAVADVLPTPPGKDPFLAVAASAADKFAVSMRDMPDLDEHRYSC